ncbi:ABC transporter permease subunit [Oceanirhabdus sp. W0125-5]|uniref:ABC transporter permease subunit n=1 Tax=Oceanirhabdus sp. W0125-5 TaxID=2999116 RepID=UPI0022F2CD09|nr:ABC transporter permease [Oceanirhabdus sp. W0125-5]WBW99011.1 ABC transporter permease [Oceanirhabdus sp. W0125-5]
MEKNNMFSRLKGKKLNSELNIVPLVFGVLCIVGIVFSGVSVNFVINQVIIRFIRNGVMVLALLIPIAAGMGLNFAVTIGAISAQIGLLLVLDWKIGGVKGILLAIIIGVVLSIFLGNLIGFCLNRVKGKEMITTIIMGFLGTSIYHFIFMVGYGTFIKPHNEEMILSRGIGVRNMVDLEQYRNTIDKIWLMKIGKIEIPLFMIFVVILFAFVIKYIMNSRLGQKFKAVGESNEKAEIIGINTSAVRRNAIVISTIIACLGHILFLQNIGMINVYTGHLNSDIFSCAALLAGGATIRSANVRNAFIGIFLFHTLFVVSPLAGQNLFSNAALGEYFRSFVAYGTIAFALIMNVKNEKKNID